LDKVLAEQAIDLSHEIDPRTAARVGQLTGANAIITGILGTVKADGSYSVRVRLTSTANGRVFVEEAIGNKQPCRPELQLPDVAAPLSRQIVDTLFTHAADYIGAPPPTRDERIAGIAASAKGGRRPAISVHFTTPQPSSAGSVISTAETELGLILQRAGFMVVDEKSTEKTGHRNQRGSNRGSGRKTRQLVPLPCRH